ncbi:Divergent AAA domain protein [Corynebacterium gerontici]|uniref:Divergent AAA domain protein n=2 Tax=Corynebacterium gerontici TaxID=2079234 RepID=A0A3G6J5X2_9CORY|nr:Divergent AAA domain protein [Corynebacterium gerontici]
MPDTIDETLAAFASTSEGGMIILGVAENGGAFDLRGVWDAKAAVDALGSKARNKIRPPMQLGAVEAHQIEGETVITCVIPPQPSDFKPFKVGDRGRAYTRSADGDYRLSALESLHLVGAGKQPRYDRDPVLEADVVRDLELLE